MKNLYEKLSELNKKSDEFRKEFMTELNEMSYNVGLDDYEVLIDEIKEDMVLLSEVIDGKLKIDW